ncbi:hypothetical protein QBC38DRAFT_352125 [Podospora fimiseda]|uniref:Zn(2)-C6 fungal-type domain-containing protein n=1 Tax=Podospora fimiseda TaxID=252190 RepID=A0AAN7C127_9PEZI|nr:hypothetical protein QBC38DRAFT_352125 [Podospora fimiseda]
MDTPADYGPEDTGLAFLEPPRSPDSTSISAQTTSSSSSSSPSSTSQPARQHRKKPIPRRGHTKSRRGCFNCKKRKVKCQETRPECESCVRIGLVCTYPETQRDLVLASSSSSSSLPSSSALSAMSSWPTPTIFTGDDMRFFHHFLVAAFPPLPLCGEKIWHDAAALSHKYDFLMHAMLGLGASHLNLFGGNCAEKGLAHRVKAIQLLNKDLAKPCSSAAEGDARFAAIFALAFQASCMPEGMTEFMSMTRGCYIVATTAVMDFDNSLFRSFTEEGYVESVRRLVTGPGSLGYNEEVLLEEFLVSLRRLGPLCRSPLEVRFLSGIERTAKRARVWAADAFAESASLYSLLFHASNEEFTPFTDPNNCSAQLLAIHFMLLEFALGHYTMGSIGHRFAYKKMVVVHWMERLFSVLPEEYKEYADWPMSYVRRLAAR